jgi:hypothetical protein
MANSEVKGSIPMEGRLSRPTREIFSDIERSYIDATGELGSFEGAVPMVVVQRCLSVGLTGRKVRA